MARVTRGTTPKNSRSGPYPMEKLRKGDKPTTVISENIARFDERQHGFARAGRGELGPVPQREMARFVPKYPLGGTFARMTASLAPVVDGEVASSRAPLPEDPVAL